MLTEEITPAQLALLAAQLMQTGISEKGAIDRAYRLYLVCKGYLWMKQEKAQEKAK